MDGWMDEHRKLVSEEGRHCEVAKLRMKKGLGGAGGVEK